jgi:PilZ domain/GYF domain 2
MDRWFICQNEKVTGPYTSDEVRAQVTGAQIPAGCLIWGRPMNQWQTIEWWTKESPQLNSATVSNTASVSTEDLPPNQQQWHFAVDGASKGPLSRIELINELKTVQNKTEILVWTKGMKAWSDLYDFHDLIDEMGLNRREHPRAPIHGSLIIKTENNTYIGQMKAISQGGFGAVQMDKSLSIGQVFNIEIKSDQLGDSINAKAIVQYVTDQGYFGCKFQSISMEAKARITEYILRTKQNVAA